MISCCTRLILPYVGGKTRCTAAVGSSERCAPCVRTPTPQGKSRRTSPLSPNWAIVAIEDMTIHSAGQSEKSRSDEAPLTTQGSISPGSCIGSQSTFNAGISPKHFGPRGDRHLGRRRGAVQVRREGPRRTARRLCSPSSRAFNPPVPDFESFGPPHLTRALVDCHLLCRFASPI